MGRLHRLGAAAAAVFLVACGSRLTEKELSANLGAVRISPAATSQAAPTAAASDAAGGAPAGEAPAIGGGAGASTAAAASGTDLHRSPLGGGRTEPPADSATGSGPDGAGQAARPGTDNRPGRARQAHSAAPDATAAPAGPAPAVPVAPDPARGEIVFGSFGTGSGPIGAQVAAIPPAVRAWQADVNARGGLAGHPVRVIFGDDGADPARALAVVRRMVESQGVVAFVATYSVTTMDTVAPYLESKGVPVIGATGGTAVEDHSPIIFNPTLGADHGIAWSYLLTIAAQSDAKKLSVFYCREAATCTNQYERIRELAPRLGFSIVHNAQISIVQPDFTAEVIAARNAGAEVVVAIMDAQSMVRVIGSAHRQGWRPVFSATHNLNTARFHSTGVDLDGTLAASATVPYTTSAKLAPYLAAMRRYAPEGEIGGYGSSAWAHLMLVERLTSAWEKPGPAPADIVAALHQVRNETLGGLIPPVTFRPGPHGAVNLCVVPMRYEQGGFRPPGGGDGEFACPPGFVPGDPDASRSAIS